MAETAKEVERKLRAAGLSKEIIRAAWPKWWSAEAELSPSALNDLKFSLSRKLGISAGSLFKEGDAVFVWKGVAKFKGLSTLSDHERQILTNFATCVASPLLKCLDPSAQMDLQATPPEELRNAFLENGIQQMDFPILFRWLYKLGIPVVYLRKFPLEAKRMTAMTVRVGDRCAILLAKDASYIAPVVFYVAHEFGHIARGHLSDGETLVDFEQAADAGSDAEESEANAFAMALLTGRQAPELAPTASPESATQLASAVTVAGREYRIDPGVLAMSFGYQTGQWELAFGALKSLYQAPEQIWRQINYATVSAVKLERLGQDQLEFLLDVLEIDL